jgi:hypothetical protein
VRCARERAPRETLVASGSAQCRAGQDSTSYTRKEKAPVVRLDSSRVVGTISNSRPALVVRLSPAQRPLACSKTHGLADRSVRSISRAGLATLHPSRFPYAHHPQLRGWRESCCRLTMFGEVLTVPTAFAQHAHATPEERTHEYYFSLQPAGFSEGSWSCKRDCSASTLNIRRTNCRITHYERDSLKPLWR